jgi:murein DD-endopeptidase MepM/ murein hydrolase activator NlpD
MIAATILGGAQELLRAAIADALFATGLGVLALAACRSLRDRWPSLRQALWTLVLLRLVLPPSLSHPWSLAALVRLWPASDAWSEGGAAGTPTGLSLDGLRAMAGGHSAAGSAWAGLAVGIWAVLVVALVCVDVRRLAACRRLVRSARPVVDPWLARRVVAWRDRLRVRRAVRVVTADVSISPFTVGLLRPVVFIPSQLLRPGRRDALRSALAHELAHVARCDALALGVERIVRRLYFFHPVAWLAARRLQEGRERLTDGLVLAHGLMGKRAYARGLLDVLQLDLQGVEAPTLHTTGGRVEMRILSILRSRGDERRQARAAGIAAAIVAVFLLPLGSGGPADATAMVRGDEKVTASSASRPLDNPLPGCRMSMAYGEAVHPIRHTPYLHRGVDLVAPAGTPVHAAADGVVETATSEYAPAPDSGSVLVIDHGRGTKTFYAHLGTIEARTGQRVRRGDVVARVGISGLTTGPHVHFEVWKGGEHVDPLSTVSGLPAAGR